MLNELLIVERGMRAAGLAMVERHADLKEARRMPTLLVRLTADGGVASVRPVPREVVPWTLRDGQHNSFPFVQPKRPLLVRHTSPVPNPVQTGRAIGQRQSVLDHAEGGTFATEDYEGWPGTSLLERLSARRGILDRINDGDGAGVPATIDRFALACGVSAQGGGRLLATIATMLVEGVRSSSQDAWAEVGEALLIGKLDAKDRRWKSTGALLFDADGPWPSVVESRVADLVSDAMRAEPALAGPPSHVATRCALTGESGDLVNGPFPQPNLPVLGQTYLFSRNPDTPSAARYGRHADGAMPVGREPSVRLAAAAVALTADEREGKTWRSIPGERPKQSDLLLAFIENAPDAAVAKLIADDEFEDESADASVAAAGRVADFETLAERTISTVKARADGDVRQTLVRLAVLRKVDPANRKVIYAGADPVEDLYEAALRWAEGEQNVPAWLAMPVLFKGERKPRDAKPPHIAPLGMVAFCRSLFVRGGTNRQEVIGLTFAEALRLFLDPTTGRSSLPARRAERVMRLTLTRRGPLCVGATHALRAGGADAARDFDRREALRTVTVFGVLLHKLGRRADAGDEGGYMNDAAFKLGQLLAAADVVHAGYCADVRGGDVPPSLLGNQVFAMAQSNPANALDALCRRWKPYEGWIARASRAIDAETNRRRDELMRENKSRATSQRGWDISRALSVGRRVKPMIDDLRPVLSLSPDIAFRAELLLGYMAGLPPIIKDDPTDKGDSTKVPTTSEGK